MSALKYAHISEISNTSPLKYEDEVIETDSMIIVITASLLQWSKMKIVANENKTVLFTSMSF